MSWLLLAAGIGLALYVLHRLALSFESRGWLYYIHRRPQVSLGVAIGAALDPAMRRMLEAKQQERKLEEDESGDKSGSRAKRSEFVRLPDDEP